jgi:hypothetical protein
MSTQPEAPRTYRISPSNYARLAQRIDKLNKRATKLGLPAVALTVVGREEEQHKDDLTGLVTLREYMRVTAEGEPPYLAGWTLVATLHHVEDQLLAHVVPGEQLPPEYLSAPRKCDHCGLDRQRKETFVLRHTDGHHTQVGRTCIADFLPGTSPAALAAWAELSNGILAVLCESEDSWGMNPLDLRYALDDFLTMTAAVIRKHGWLSKGKAREQERPSDATVERVLWQYSSEIRRYPAEVLHPNDADCALADAALAWAQALPEDTDSEYLHNLRVMAGVGAIEPRWAGYAASIIAAYQREQLRAQERAEEPVSNWVGAVGKRQVFTGLLVKSVRTIDSDGPWLRQLCLLTDPEGNVLKWWTGTEALREGKTVTLKATVKAHEEYRGRKETVITRATVVETETA